MEIAVISGKGGTGKSSISAALATIAGPVVLADCDVDAANLYILFEPTHEEETVYIGAQNAVINYDLCLNCGICADYCRFDAINFVGNRITVQETSCDGCRLCSRICPVEAITMVDSDRSRIYSGTFRNGKMVYGRLAPGEENSGKMVNIVRDKAKELAKEHHIETIIIDGPPGIGCPVISTITGVDKVVIVTEPSISGLKDLERTLETVSKFNLKACVLINKFDLNEEMANRIINFCSDSDIPVLGKLPFDKIVVDAMSVRKSVIENAPDSELSMEIKKIQKKLIPN
jgi:MinD superfamily P-loop ATPase